MKTEPYSPFGELVIEEVLDLLVDISFQCQLVSRVLVNPGDFASQVTMLDSGLFD